MEDLAYVTTIYALTIIRTKLDLDGRDYISEVPRSSKRRIAETSFRVGTCGDGSENGSEVEELHVE